MKYRFATLIIPFMLLLAAPTDASYWFKVINVTPIEMTANSEANFTVSVKGMGSQRAYVELVFKNQSQGFDFACPRMIKNVYPAGVTDYSCSVKAGDVAAGNYSFVVDAIAESARPGKMNAYINVVEEKSRNGELYDRWIGHPENTTEAAGSGPKASVNAGQPSSQENPDASASEAAKESPMPGAASTILGLLIVLGWMKR